MFPDAFREHIGFSANASGVCDGTQYRACMQQAILIFALIFMTERPDDAQVLRVPGDYPRIQAAIDVAVEGSTVLVAPGHYTECLDLLGKAVTVRSEAGPDKTTINGRCGGTVVCMVHGEGANTVIEGFVLTGGVGDAGFGGYRNGGGLRIEGASPTIRRCIVTGNTADLGAAAYLVDSAATFESCWFDRNVSTHGAEIDCTSSDPRLIRCGLHDDGIAWRDVGMISIRDDCGESGACCIRDACVMATQDACEDARGLWRGGNVDCAGSPCPPPCAADVTGDGVVNMTDLLRVLDAWGWCTARVP
jgi:hypothetical protein